MHKENTKVVTNDHLKFFVFCLLLLFTPVISQVNHDNIFNAERNATEDEHFGECSQFLHLENGIVNITRAANENTLHFSCKPGYQLSGPPKLLCPVKESKFYVKTYCNRGCSEPPMVLNGAVKVKRKGDTEFLAEGDIAEYACLKTGFKLDPLSSQQRVCHHGQWSGVPVTCVCDGCQRIDHVLNGGIQYLDREGIISVKEILEPDFNCLKVGTKIFFNCKEGFTLEGPTHTTCLPSGHWQTPETVCTPDYRAPNIEPNKCPAPSLGPHVRISEVQGMEAANSVDDGTVIEATCAPGYRDKTLVSCEPQMMRCVKGNWQGRMPNCLKVDDCIFPLKIPHGEVETVEGGVGGGRFGIGGQITYNCLQGYQLYGEALLTCEIGGCWEPNTMPYCEPQFYLSTSWPDYLNANTSLLFSVVTALSVLFVLLSVCVAVVCRHRPSSHHHHHPPAPPPTLAPPPPDPDRVALIAFADGIQSGLPSYEEAIRSGGRGLLSYRLHHPPWGQRRNPRPDNSHMARQLSSTGDSMGSTDTMTVSDVSTTVTLDTVSCHTCSSTSQTASCRAICGSLASFDTSSVLNTEGVPLLEENELEESGAVVGMDVNAVSPACDNTSFKLQSDIDSIHS